MLVPVITVRPREPPVRTVTPLAMRKLTPLLWGRTPQYGVRPAVQAYAGELPDGEEGFEFFALAPPDRPYGPQVYWRVRSDSSVEGDQEWAKLKVLVSRVTQEL